MGYGKVRKGVEMVWFMCCIQCQIKLQPLSRSIGFIATPHKLYTNWLTVDVYMEQVSQKYEQRA